MSDGKARQKRKFKEVPVKGNIFFNKKVKYTNNGISANDKMLEDYVKDAIKEYNEQKGTLMVPGTNIPKGPYQAGTVDNVSQYQTTMSGASGPAATQQPATPQQPASNVTYVGPKGATYSSAKLQNMLKAAQSRNPGKKITVDDIIRKLNLKQQ